MVLIGVIVLAFACGFAWGQIYQRAQMNVERVKLRRWIMIRSIFGTADPVSGEYVSGIFAGQNSVRVMANLGHPMPPCS